MNNRKRRLTPDELRKYPGNEHWKDEEAEEIVITLEKLAHITYTIYQKDLKKGVIGKDGKISSK